MAYNITDNSELEIYINDGWREWYIPKFRMRWEVNEPNIRLYWTDTEKPGNGITRTLLLDYNDVQFGYLTPTSASEIAIVLQSYIISSWDNIWNNFANYVPYVGATQNVDLGTYGLTADFVAFDLNPINLPGAGQIAYDGQTGSLTYLLNNSNVPSHIGQTLHAYVHNAEGSPIYKGDAVYLYQATGNKGSVKLARNLSDSTSAKTFGLCAEDIGTGQNGMVICQGQLQGVDTSMFAEGDTLYLANTYGDLTNVKPYAPEHLVYIGIVEKANANGEIYVRVQNGYELNEIHDVDLITTPPISGDVLTYNGTLWVAQAPTGGSGITSLNSQTGATQTFATGSSGSDFNIASATNTHTFNIPTASASNRGLLSTSDWTTFNSKFTLPALTSGSVLFSNGTTIAQDNANLFWDDTNNRMGIGTNAPSDPLHVKGTGSGVAGRTWGRVENTQLNSAAGIQFVNGNGRFAAFQYSGSGYLGGEFFAVYTQNDYPLVFATNGASTGGTSHIAFSPGSNERMRITNGGNVLIGTTTDGIFKLDVNGQVRSQGRLTVLGVAELTLNQNASTYVQVTNSTSGASSVASLTAVSSNGSIVVGKYSATTTAYKTVLANDGYLYLNNAGNINILNDVATGTIKFTAGGSSTVHWTINSNGNLEANNAINMVFGTTTGTKIGTATTQKIGFWNATPIVQPTTAVAGATFTAVAGGSTIDTNDTFDGYTVGQVVKALRNLGILA